MVGDMAAGASAIPYCALAFSCSGMIRPTGNTAGWPKTIWNVSNIMPGDKCPSSVAGQHKAGMNWRRVSKEMPRRELL